MESSSFLLARSIFETSSIFCARVFSRDCTDVTVDEDEASREHSVVVVVGLNLDGIPTNRQDR